MKFSAVITFDKSDVHTKGQGEMSFISRGSLLFIFKASSIVHEPEELLVPFWVASSPIHFLKAQNLYFMKKSGGHVYKVA